MSLFAESEIVIIGGGAIGCGVAYSLARRGTATSWCSSVRGTSVRSPPRRAPGSAGRCARAWTACGSRCTRSATFRELQQDAETRPDWHEVGSIRLAFSPARVEELRGLAGRLRAGRPGGRPDRPRRGRAALAAARSQRRPGGALVSLRRVHDARSRWRRRTSAGAGAWACASRRGRRSRGSSLATGASPRCRRTAARSVAEWSSTRRARTRITSPASQVSSSPSSPCGTSTTTRSRSPGSSPDLPCFRIPEMTPVRSRDRGAPAARRLGGERPEHRPPRATDWRRTRPSSRRTSAYSTASRRSSRASCPRPGAPPGRASARAGRRSRPTAGSSSVRAAASGGS